MPFDTLVMAAVAAEIRAMTGARVMKIYQPRKADVVLRLRGPGAARQLLISAGSDSSRVHFVAHGGENPKFPPVFCMLLRKHLEGARLASVIQPPHERILFLEFEGRNELGIAQTYTLVAETMGRRSNIILLDGSMTIVDAVRRASLEVNLVREVLPGKPYVPPPTRPRVAPQDLTVDELRGWLAADPSRTCEELLVNNVMGVSPATARHACAIAGGDTRRVVDEVRVIAGGVPARPVVYMDGARPLDYYCFHLAQYEGLPRREYPTMSEALDAFYTARAAREALTSVARSLRSVVRKAQEKAASRLEMQRRDLNEGMKAEEYRLYGEILTAYGASIAGATEARLPNYYIEGSPEITIPLDPSLDGRQNAQVYFKKYGKAKAAREQSEKRIAATEAEIAYLEQIDTMIEHAGTIEDLREVETELISQGYLAHSHSSESDFPLGAGLQRHELKGMGGRGGAGTGAGAAGRPGASRPHMVMSSDGYEILVGRNNRQNDMITKSANPEDVWLHARQMAGAHVILRYPRDKGKPPEGWPPEASLIEAAAIAAYFSKGRGSARTPVDYTLARHVWKPRGARPGMVLYDHQKTLYVQPRNLLDRTAGPTESTPQ